MELRQWLRCAYTIRLIMAKKDACYHKVKARYKVWPSAYASGALAKCRKKGAKNWGTGGKKKKKMAHGGKICCLMEYQKD